MSPRAALLDAVMACLVQIRIADGYATDSGALATTELDQIEPDAAASLSTFVLRQARATEPALVRTHRLTEVGIAIKVPTGLSDAQARMDAAVGDVERAMDPVAARPRFAVGTAFPQYVEMRPLAPEDGTKGWVGALLVYQTHIPIK